MSDKIYEDESVEYNEIIKNIRAEYKKKIEDEIALAKEQMNKEAADILGREFAIAVVERKKLIGEYSVNSKAVLTYAVKNGLREEVKLLDDWAKEYGKNKGEREKGSILLNDIVAKVAHLNPKLIIELKRSERKLVENNALLIELIKSKKALLEKLQKDHRERLKNTLVKLILQFTNKIVAINKEFGVKNAKIEPPEIDDQAINISVEPEIENDEDFFIPSDSGDLN